MCNIWKSDHNKHREFKPELLQKLPALSFCNVTGGEPFLREDIGEIIGILKRKAKRIVISTNGFFTDRIVDIAKKFNDIGIRISLEGLSSVNDELRGVKGSFDRAVRTILNLKEIGIKDIGFGITVSEKNYNDMIDLFHLAKFLKVEFATAVPHNSYYFHKKDNIIKEKENVCKAFDQISSEQIKSNFPKNWFRAYFNQGIINNIRGYPRLLKCMAGNNSFFLDPYGEILPCNGMEDDVWFQSMGNLHKKSFDRIWNSESAQKARGYTDKCPKNCWMIGNAAPVMKKNIFKTSRWVIKKKILSVLKK